MYVLSYIIWNLDPEILDKPLAIRWYGLLFALGFLISQQVLFYIFKKEAGTELQKRKAEKMVESLTVYMILATVIGARLGHVIFYQPEDYFTSWEGILRIFNIREGGLASHGAAIAIILVIWLFSRYRFNVKEGQPAKLFFVRANRGYNFFQIIDRIVIVVALTGALIRTGNFANSEIIGKPTGSDYGMVFAREVTEYLLYDATGAGWIDDVYYRKNTEAKPDEHGHVPIYIYLQFKKRRFYEADLRAYLDNGVNIKLSRIKDHLDEPVLHNLDYVLVQESDGTWIARIATYAIPRHPAQLYEAGTTFLLFLLLFFIWSRKKRNTPPGSLFGIFLVVLFTLRFIHEFIKENQVPFEDNMVLNMGQWLSIPMVVLGIVVLYLVAKGKTGVIGVDDPPAGDSKGQSGRKQEEHYPPTNGMPYQE